MLFIHLPLSYLLYRDVGYISSSSFKSFIVNGEENCKNYDFFSYYAHTAPIFRDLKILTIDKLIVHRIGIAMYKLNNGFLPDVLKTMYRKNSDIHIYNTRSKDMFQISSGSQSFSNISAKI